MSAPRGVVACGHRMTAEAGAQVLAEAVTPSTRPSVGILTSFVCESQSDSRLRRGGFMMVTRAAIAP